MSDSETDGPNEDTRGQVVKFDVTSPRPEAEESLGTTPSSEPKGAEPEPSEQEAAELPSSEDPKRYGSG